MPAPASSAAGSSPGRPTTSAAVAAARQVTGRGGRPPSPIPGDYQPKTCFPRTAYAGSAGNHPARQTLARRRRAGQLRRQTLAGRAHRGTHRPRTARYSRARQGGGYAGRHRRTRGVTVPVLATAAALASSPPPLPGFLNALASPLQHYGLWAIGLLIMLEDFGIPVPGETILIAGAIYAGAGRLNIVAVGVVGFIAAIIGDNIGFAIGHFGGRALALRWGRYVFLTGERLDSTERFFDRHGGKVIVIARFIEGLRQANGIIAGIAGMRWLRFLAFNALGAALWVGTWVSLGYLAGKHIGTIYHYITRYSYYALIALAVLIVG